MTAVFSKIIKQDPDRGRQKVGKNSSSIQIRVKLKAVSESEGGFNIYSGYASVK
jgi:hypothetical protein